VIAPFNFFGYTADDPLDRASSGWARDLVMVGVTAIVTYFFLRLVYFDLHIATLKYPWLFWVELSFFCAWSLVVVRLRKSSSLLLVLVFVLIALPLDLALEDHVRMKGGQACWMYPKDSILGGLDPVTRGLAVWVGDALVEMPLCLFLARVVGYFLFKKESGEPTKEQYAAVFADPWTREKIENPPPRFKVKNGEPTGFGLRDFGFVVYRAIGLAYFGYMIVVALGGTGFHAFPKSVQDLLKMSYENPGLTINTFMKIVTMSMVAFIGAYNRALRWHMGLILLVGHVVSTGASLFFAFGVPGASYRTFLLTSAAFDGVIIAFILAVMFKHRDEADDFRRPADFPEFFTIPQRVTRIFFYAFGTVCAGLVVVFFCVRLFGDGEKSIGAAYGYPDPQLCNTLTKYAALSCIAYLMARHDRLREELYPVLVLVFGFSVLCSSLWFLLGDMLFQGVYFTTRTLHHVRVDWHFIGNVLLDGSTVILLLLLRKMFYDVDLSISALSPSSARNAMAFHEAIYRPRYATDDDNVDEDNGHIAVMMDRHVAGIRGRKRGLLNFPFFLFEVVFAPLFGLRPPFSSMSPEERAYFLRKYVLRPPNERARAFIPLLADLVQQLGIAAHAFVTLAHYSHRKGHEDIWIAPDARDRLQGEVPTAPPPGKELELPKDPKDPKNDRTTLPTPGPLVAPRVVTAIREPRIAPKRPAAKKPAEPPKPIPRDFDYVVVGSGAGGAVMAYRLACGDPGASILVVERGARYSPVTDYTDDEMEMMRKLYKEGGLQQTKTFDLVILQGECVGGTTVINNAICVEMPQKVRDAWSEDFGLDMSGIQAEYDLVADEIDIREIEDVSVNVRVDSEFRKAVAKYNDNDDYEKLGEPFRLKANVRGGLGSGLDILGDRRMRKRSMLETYLPWAEARGAQVISETTAVRFIADGKRAKSVMLRTSMGRIETVNVNKAVIVAGGVIASSHFLMRSEVGLSVGQHVAANFGLPSVFELEPQLDAFDGIQIMVATEDPKNRAVFETYFGPPGSYGVALPFQFDIHHSLMNQYRHLVTVGALVGAEARGTVERKASVLDGRAVSWDLGPLDQESLRYALSTQVRLAQAAGARRVVLPMQPGVVLPLKEDPRACERFCKAIATYPLRMGDIRLVTAHPQGGNRMAKKQDKEPTVGPDFRVLGYDNVYVADASIFPTSITVNPQWTVMAIASLAAKRVLAR